MSVTVTVPMPVSVSWLCLCVAVSVSVSSHFTYSLSQSVPLKVCIFVSHCTIQCALQLTVLVCRGAHSDGSVQLASLGTYDGARYSAALSQTHRLVAAESFSRFHTNPPVTSNICRGGCSHSNAHNTHIVRIVIHIVTNETHTEVNK